MGPATVSEIYFLYHRIVFHNSYFPSIHSVRKMKWTIPFFLGTIWCMQLVGQAASAIVRERLNVDDDNEVIAKHARQHATACKGDKPKSGMQRRRKYDDGG